MTEYFARMKRAKGKVSGPSFMSELKLRPPKKEAVKKPCSKYFRRFCVSCWFGIFYRGVEELFCRLAVLRHLLELPGAYVSGSIVAGCMWDKPRAVRSEFSASRARELVWF